MARLEFGPNLTKKEKAEIDESLKKLRKEFDAKMSQQRNAPPVTVKAPPDHRPALREELQRIQVEHEAEKQRMAQQHAEELAAAHAARQSAEQAYADQQQRLHSRLADPDVHARAAKLNAIETAKTRAIVHSDLTYDERVTGEKPKAEPEEVITRFTSAEKDDMPGVLRDDVAGGWGERMYKRFMTWRRGGA